MERSIQLFNGLSQWIQCMVLSKTTPKQRADVIHKFIEVAKVIKLNKFQKYSLKTSKKIFIFLITIAFTSITKLQYLNGCYWWYLS